ncbi:unnamed protein product [Gadus morhua 'NCC']
MDVSSLDDISVLVCSGCSLEMAVAFSVEKEGDAEVVDIVTEDACCPGSFVLFTEVDVIVTVSCVDKLDVSTPELSSRVEDETTLSSGVTEAGFDWLVGVSVLYREEAGYAVVPELSIVSWDSFVTDGFFVLNVDVDDSVSVSLGDPSDVTSPEPSSVDAKMELASAVIED